MKEFQTNSVGKIGKSKCLYRGSLAHLGVELARPFISKLPLLGLDKSVMSILYWFILFSCKAVVTRFSSVYTFGGLMFNVL